MAQRLPTPGSDNGTWGDILNAYLEISLASDGTLNSNTVGTNQIQNNAITNAQLDSPTQTAIASIASKYVKPGGGIPKSDLANSVQTSLSTADSSVQSVNNKTPTSGNVTLAASDVNAIPSSQLGAASGVATLNSSSQLTSGQVPTAVANVSSAYANGHIAPRGPVVSLEDFSAAGNGVITPGSGTGGSLTGTDDTAAFKSALAQLAPGVETTQGGGYVMLGPNNYYLNGSPDNTYFGNAVVPLPTMGYSKAQLNAISANIPFDVPTIKFVGVPGLTRIICPRTDAYSSSNGPLSIIGGPTVEGLGLTNTPPALPLRVEFEGITFVMPDQPVGGALDLATLTSVSVRNCRFFTTTTLNFETSGNSPANLPGAGSFGVRMPITGGMESRSSIADCILNGYGSLIVAGNWTNITSCVGNFSRTILGIDDTMGSNAPTIINGFGATGTNYLITGWSPSAGVKSLTTTASSAPRDVYGSMSQYQWTSPYTLTADFLDANHLIGGDISTYIWPTVFGFSGTPAINGKGPNLRSQPMDQGNISGSATLASGTVTVSATSVATTTRIRCGILTPGGTVGSPFIFSVTAGTGFTIKSTSGSDTSVVWWEITNP